jgi:uncharacterized alkaline shock family protein YloU
MIDQLMKNVQMEVVLELHELTNKDIIEVRIRVHNINIEISIRL